MSDQTKPERNDNESSEIGKLQGGTREHRKIDNAAQGTSVPEKGEHEKPEKQDTGTVFKEKTDSKAEKDK